MDFTDILLLLVIMFTLAALPSTSVALVITRSATLGLANGIAVVAGIVIGDLGFVALALFGLSIGAEALGDFFSNINYVAGAYLVGMGITLLLKPPAWASVNTPAHNGGSLSVSFLAGLLLTLGDVKAIAFYTSLLPLFLHTDPVNTLDRGIIAFVTITAVGGAKMAYALAARRFITLSRAMSHARYIQIIAVCCLFGAGVGTIARA